MLPVRKSLPHTAPAWVRADEAIFFLTICGQRRGANQFCSPSTAAGLLDSIAFRHQRGDWWVHLWLLMPDHVHALVSTPSDRPLSKVVAQWKEFTTKTLAVQWQRSFFEHRLRHDESFDAKADYILQNPVRKGLIARAEDWPYRWMPQK